ncbi:MAG: hypothetical protein LBU56_04570 [Rickettsiales bacterium]|nr:hypothetical protein [Rickettsiales bacterium]
MTRRGYWDNTHNLVIPARDARSNFLANSSKMLYNVLVYDQFCWISVSSTRITLSAM